MITLDNRLKTAAKLCREGKIAADVGCDHAQLACYIAGRSRLVIASDVRDGPLRAARKTVAEQGVRNVRVVRSDGLRGIDYADDVIICGMGGELIAEIMSGCRFLSGDTRFILQPMTKPAFLRRWLYGNGFEIIEERTAVDGGRYYSIMYVKFTGVKRETDELTALTGKITDSAMLRRIAEKLMKNAERMSGSERCRDEAAALRELAEQVLKKTEVC